MKEKLIVAIDGPAASGKSSVSRLVAERIGGIYVDSGSVYRGLTWQALRGKVDVNDPGAVARLPGRLDVNFFVRSNAVSFTINGEEPGQALRTEQVNKNVSLVAKVPEVREWVVARLRETAALGSIVMEGRDIGTAVFPDAPFKFYLDADPVERARRRYLEQKKAGDSTEADDVRELLVKRDSIDKTRAKDPLKAAADAEIIDTTLMSLEQVADYIVRKMER